MGAESKSQTTGSDQFVAQFTDENGYEWYTSDDGKNWYRKQGSTDEWIEFSN